MLTKNRKIIETPIQGRNIAARIVNVKKLNYETNGLALTIQILNGKYA